MQAHRAYSVPRAAASIGQRTQAPPLPFPPRSGGPRLHCASLIDPQRPPAARRQGARCALCGRAHPPTDFYAAAAAARAAALSLDDDPSCFLAVARQGALSPKTYAWRFLALLQAPPPFPSGPPAPPTFGGGAPTPRGAHNPPLLRAPPGGGAADGGRPAQLRHPERLPLHQQGMQPPPLTSARRGGVLVFDGCGLCAQRDRGAWRADGGARARRASRGRRRGASWRRRGREMTTDSGRTASSHST